MHQYHLWTIHLCVRPKGLLEALLKRKAYWSVREALSKVTEFSLEPSGLYGGLYKLEIEVENDNNASVRKKFKLTTEISLKNG